MIQKIEHKAQWAISREGRPIELYQRLHPGERPYLFIGGVHGDEPEGVELAQKFLAWLFEHETKGTTLHSWLLIPCLNIDGYLKNNRLNGAGVDLNRNYPSLDWSPLIAKERYHPGSAPASEPEVQAVVSLIKATNPSLIVHFHSWNPCIVYTGELGAAPAKFIAKRTPYEAKEDIGYPTPGSLGQYGWLNHQTPVICIEERDHSPLEQVWSHFNKALPEFMTVYTHDIKTLVIDLDDTLLDTSALIVPNAARKSCEILLNATAAPPKNQEDALNQILQMRTELAVGHSHKVIFQKIADFLKVTDSTPINQAIESFYCPEIPPTLPLMPGALELLEALVKKYSLYLVTSGDEKTQRKKVEALKVQKYFKDILICNSLKGDTKKAALEKVLKLSATQPWQVLSLGNRLSSEIRESKALGIHTCHFIYGDHADEVPIKPEDHPDFTITHLSDLMSTCRL